MVCAGDEASWQAALFQAGEYSAKMSALTRGLQLLELDKGTCHLELQSGEGTWTASLDLSSVPAEQGEIVAVTQYLLFLLGKHGVVQTKRV